MELLERYLWAVGKYLPEATRADTIAELRANLLEQMDARSDELERPLTDDDVAVILKDHGKPEFVAARYLPQRSLIGPTVFPFYILTLKRVMPLIIVVCAAAQALEFITAERQSFGRATGNFFSGTIYSCFLSAAIITLVFVGIEYGMSVNQKGSTWNTFDPYKLAKVPIEQRIAPKSMTKRVVHLVVHCLWILWVVSLAWTQVWHLGRVTVGVNLESLGATPGPLWHIWYGLMLALLGVQLMARILALRDGPSPWVGALDLLGHLFGIAALVWLVQGSDYLVASGAATNLVNLDAANQGIAVVLRITLVFALLGLGKKVWAYFRQHRATSMLAF